MTPSEAKIRQQIAREIQDAKPKHVLRNYTQVDKAYDDASRIARGGLSWSDLYETSEYGKTIQYGVQIVYGDPVASGVVEKGHEDEYVPKWYVFDTKEQANRFHELSESRIRTPYEFGGIKEINRATRWAEENYGEWEV